MAENTGDGGRQSEARGIKSVRDEINRIDHELLALLAERRACSGEVVRVKDREEIPVRDRQREEELLLERIQSAKSHGLDAHYVTRVFHEILEDSVRVQQEYLQRRANAEQAAGSIARVSFQGIEGAYSQLAAEKYFAMRSDRVVYIGCPTFKEAMAAVEQGQADYVMLPIENTTSGGINQVYDLLLHTQLAIVGEATHRESYCLLGLSGANLSQIRKIYCAPQAILQCSNFLARLGSCQIEYLSDPAASSKRIKDEQDPSCAALASEEAARLFGLTVLQSSIANQDESFTRFLVAARKPIVVDLRIPCKTSIVMSTAQEPGSLVEALLIFRENGINLTKLESRPVLGNPWEEMFYVDFEGNIADVRVQRALDDATRKARFIKVLGCYPSEDVSPTRVTPEQVAAVNGDSASKVEVKAVDKCVAPAPKASSKAKGYRLGSREYKGEDTIIEVKGVRIGGKGFVVIAGPCSVESYEQVTACAREVKEHGGAMLRGGCFKPRSSPYSFQGLGFEGLDMLADVGRKYGLPIVTEVLSAEDIQRVAEKSDIIQIGARNMQNFTLLSEAGRIHRPVLLKRGMSSSIEELLQAAEYILAQGNQQVILCERGIRTFETATRSTLDLSAVPVLKMRSHLPVIVDPSHAAGDRELVPPLALAAKAVGADGIIVEIHPEPEKALSDGPQALRFPQFEEMMVRLLR
jgi:chorismate mutase / prephenate dehydratase